VQVIDEFTDQPFIGVYLFVKFGGGTGCDYFSAYRACPPAPAGDSLFVRTYQRFRVAVGDEIAGLAWKILPDPASSVGTDPGRFRPVDGSYPTMYCQGRPKTTASFGCSDSGRTVPKQNHGFAHFTHQPAPSLLI